MIGKRWWIVIWYGILLLGVAGTIMAVNWGRLTRWKNLDEILRGVGTITCSTGMLLLLHSSGTGAAQTLLLAALIAFVMAFIIGREQDKLTRRPPDPQ
jgi:hypothetical protein